MKKSNTDKIKDAAARRWHRPGVRGATSLADEWVNPPAYPQQYSNVFAIHEGAYVAGYLAGKKAAQRDARRKK